MSSKTRIYSAHSPWIMRTSVACALTARAQPTHSQRTALLSTHIRVSNRSFIDGNHTYAAVRSDYEIFAPRCRTVMFHDIQVRSGLLSRLLTSSHCCILGSTHLSPLTSDSTSLHIICHITGLNDDTPGRRRRALALAAAREQHTGGSRHSIHRPAQYTQANVWHRPDRTKPAHRHRRR